MAKNKLWEYCPIDPARPLRYSCRFMRTAILPAVAEPHPMSAFPGTMVLAEQRLQHCQRTPNSRQIFFVLTGGFHTDGLWLPNINHRRFRDSTVADAHTLGPRGRRYSTVSRSDRHLFRHHRKLIAAQWAAELADSSPCQVYRSRWRSAVDWFTRSRPDATDIALRSEIEIVSTSANLPRGSCVFAGLPLVQEEFYHPAIPNQVPGALGTRDVVAFARICAPMQADAGLTKWTQRIFTIDYADWFDGKLLRVPPRNSYQYRSALSIAPGLLGKHFDPRIFDGYNLDILSSRRTSFTKDEQ